MKTKKLSDTAMRIAFSKGQEFAEETAYRGKLVGGGYDSENNRRIELAFLYGALGDTYQEASKKIEEEMK